MTSGSGNDNIIVVKRNDQFIWPESKSWSEKIDGASSHHCGLGSLIHWRLSTAIKASDADGWIHYDQTVLVEGKTDMIFNLLRREMSVYMNMSKLQGQKEEKWSAANFILSVIRDIYQLWPISVSHDCCDLDLFVVFIFSADLLVDAFGYGLVLALQRNQCKYPCIFNALYSLCA